MSVLLFLGVLSFALVVSGEAVPSQDPYEVLGVDRTATQGEIRKTYKKLAMIYHPDKNGSEEAANKFSAINNAYEIIGNPDKRAVYDDFGKSATGHTGFNSYWEYMRSNTKSDNDFYIGDSMITRLTRQLWDQRIQGDSIWLVNFYAPWCTHCQQAIPKYKALAGRLDGVIEVAALNCHKDQQFCQNLGIGEYPTFILFYPKMNFEQKFQYGQGDIDVMLYDWATSRAQEWRRLADVAIIEPVTVANVQEKVWKSEDFWVVMFGSSYAKARCDSARIGLVQLAANLKGLAKVGIVDCDKDTPICASENPGKSLYYNVFPIFRIYSKGKENKISEEVFQSGQVNSVHGLEIVEKTAKLLLRNQNVKTEL